MSYPNFHAARINDPKKYKRLRPNNDQSDKGIAVICGVKEDNTTEVQAIHFDKNLFTVAESKEWMNKKDYLPIEFEPASEKSESKEIKYKTFAFEVSSTKEVTENNQQYGIIEGYASTYSNVDLGGDVVVKGAFTKTLADYNSKNRPIKMCFQHSGFDIIGGFDPNQIIDDDKGLFVVGKINLDVQRGKEAYALAKQGVLTDMSIGYVTRDFDIQGNVCYLKQIDLYEISMVGNPMNTEAQISAVKSNNAKSFDIENVKNFDDKELITALSDLGLLSKQKQESLFKRCIEDVLSKSNYFTKNAATFLASHYSEWSDSSSKQSESGNESFLVKLKELRDTITKL